MAILSRSELEALAGEEPGICVSLYMPRQQPWPDANRDRITYKNLIKETKNLLEQSDIDDGGANELLRPVVDLQDEPDFWNTPSAGVAIFASENAFHRYHLPVNFDQLATVTRRYHLKPLMPLLSVGGRFFVMALSQKDIRLLECTQESCRQVEIPDKPYGLEDVVQIPREQALQQHRTSSGTGKGDAVYHGGHKGRDVKLRKIQRYFEELEKAAQQVLSEEHVPLVLAGVDYLRSLYRDTTDYRVLADEGISGNPDELDLQQLRDRAWKIVEPIFQQAEKDAIDSYHELAGTNRTTNELQEAVPAAHHGRVDAILVARDVHKWGRFDPQSLDIELEDEMTPENEDLLDLAAVQTLLNGGHAHTIPSDRLPSHSPIAAIFRY